ncbi:reprolysin-like metallopeptidase [uncultured Kordia sp.]|uniref:reprolysin-like metallopeptidase n=1 Tax=uncultured Kordia sp. TaxID=507699 RepID=UPI0026268BC9|nr:zinc-dependent metalloprotease family protein [uncultured Kordia sp.]
MKKNLLFIVLAAMLHFSMAQAQGRQNFWSTSQKSLNSNIVEHNKDLPTTKVFDLNLDGFKSALQNAPQRDGTNSNSNIVLSFPNAKGEMERFQIFEAPVLHPDLAARYPGIKSYAGQGIDNPTAVIRFSVSPLGIQTMRLSASEKAVFIEPISNDRTTYTVYERADRSASLSDFECQVTDDMSLNTESTTARPNADDGTLRTYRLAVSTTGEYTAFHGGTKAGALAAINTTMTRVNGVFENDFNVTMVVIANNDDVIYTNASTDPYSNGSFNSQVQNTLTSVIGEANYDVGHLFARASDNGNAGCIGCVCVNRQKGSAFTSRSTPVGDPFDIDYVAHELGHQFGANHTFSFRNEGTNAHFEPGSGTTIMGYAGITGATDVQSNSDPYFHWFSIEQVTNYVKSTSCQTNTATGNATPTADAGSNYTIPKGTPFVLTGNGTDADGDSLTYCWEQSDENNAATTYPSVTGTSGVAFRSFNPTTSTSRYFPRLSTIKSGATSWQWEAVPNVARTLNFRLTVRDNRAGGAANNSDDMVVTVNGTAGPFVVNAPNSAVTWNAGTTQTVTWNVAGTTGNGVNAANVDILLSTDGGDTYPITLASNVTNDGSHDIVVPNNQGSQNRIMVKGSNHIFFDISNANFTIAGQVTCNATVPTGVTVSSITAAGASVSWDAVQGATYDVRYRATGTTSWTTNAVTGTSTSLSGLAAATEYEVQVRSKCTSGNSAYSTSTNFTTTSVQLNYCDSQSTNINDEYIGRVQLNTIDNSSGGQFYTDFTSISTDVSKSQAYTITVTPTWTGTVYSEGYSVWIDYNQDGDFTDAGEQVWSRAATTNTPVSGTFTIPNSATDGATRMRVSMKYNGIPTSCETFTYGEVEDYTVVVGAAGPDTQAPSIPTGLSASGTTQTETTLSWTAATDNVGVTGYEVFQDGVSIGTTSGTSLNVTGLTEATTYAFTVQAQDAAGNVSASSAALNVTTLSAATGVTLTLNFDNYPEETSWEIRNSSNQIVASGGTYGSQPDGSTLVINQNLPAGCYSLIVRDSYGDGMCCSWGTGSYSLNEGSTVLASGASFGSSETSNFCVGGATSRGDNPISSTVDDTDDTIVFNVTIYPNPVRGNEIKLLLKDQGIQQSTYVIRDLVGRNVKEGVLATKTINVANLPRGIYLIQISNGDTTTTKKLIRE